MKFLEQKNQSITALFKEISLLYKKEYNIELYFSNESGKIGSSEEDTLLKHLNLFFKNLEEEKKEKIKNIFIKYYKENTFETVAELRRIYWLSILLNEESILKNSVQKAIIFLKDKYTRPFIFLRELKEISVNFNNFYSMLDNEQINFINFYLKVLNEENTPKIINYAEKNLQELKQYFQNKDSEKEEKIIQSIINYKLKYIEKFNNQHSDNYKKEILTYFKNKNFEIDSLSTISILIEKEILSKKEINEIFEKNNLYIKKNILKILLKKRNLEDFLEYKDTALNMHKNFKIRFEQSELKKIFSLIEFNEVDNNILNNIFQLILDKKILENENHKFSFIAKKDLTKEEISFFKNIFSKGFLNEDKNFKNFILFLQEKSDSTIEKILNIEEVKSNKYEILKNILNKYPNYKLNFSKKILKKLFNINENNVDNILYNTFIDVLLRNMNDKDYRIKITKILKIFPNNYFKNNDIRKETLQQMKISLAYPGKNLEEIIEKVMENTSFGLNKEGILILLRDNFYELFIKLNLKEKFLNTNIVSSFQGLKEEIIKDMHDYELNYMVNKKDILNATKTARELHNSFKKKKLFLNLNSTIS